MEYTLGFKLDGFDKYKNMSKVSPKYAELQVLSNPVIDKFEGEDQTKTFRPSWPDKQTTLEIKVRPYMDTCILIDFSIGCSDRKHM